MGERVRNWLLALAAIIVVGVLALNVAWPLPALEGAWMWPTGLMAFPVAAALVLARRPGNVIGRILGVVALGAGVGFTLFWYAMTFPDSPMSRLAEAVSGAAVMTQFWGTLAILHLFPTGRPLSRRHAWVVTGLGWFSVLMAVLALTANPLPDSGRPNPIWAAPEWAAALLQAGLFALPAFALLGVVALSKRWRRAAQVERAQLKWFLAGAGLLVVLLTVVVFVPESANPGVEEGLVAVAGFWGLPASIVVAITRYRLYDIDHLLSRTVAYVLLTGVLGMTYAVGVVALSRLLAPVTGATELAVVGSTLTIATLFGPARRRIQLLVDRRFDRARYDAQRTIESFRLRLRDELDIDDVTSELASTIEATVAPVSLQIWLGPRGPVDR